MSDKSPVRSQIKRVYNWRQPDITKVPQVTREVILPFLEPDPHFSASVGHEDDTAITQEHSSFDSWSAALSSNWDWFKLNLNSNDWSRVARIDFNLKRQQINARLEMDGPDAQPLTEVLAGFQQVMTLGEPIPSSPGSQNKERLEGRYHLEHPEDVSWFQKLLDILERWVGYQQYFNGSFTLTATPHFRRSPSQYADWKDQCVRNWKDIVDLDAHLTGEPHESSLRYYANRAELSVTLQSYDTQELADLFATLEKDLPIIASQNTGVAVSRQGERRRYFAAEQIDRAWFNRSLPLLRSILKGNISFQGRYRAATPNDQDRAAALNEEDVSRTDYEAWVREVESRWDQLVWLYCWMSSPEATITVDVDLLRDLVTLDLQAPTEEMSTASFNTLELGLKLVKLQGNPYRYRRFLRAFKIERWTTNEKFAQALQAAVDVAFPNRIPGRRVAMTTAIVAVGESEEDLEPFTNYGLFQRRIASQQEFTRAELTLEGPHGRTLGIEVNRKKERLTIRTALERADLDSLTRPFRNAMDLKLTESTDEPDKKKAEGDKVTRAMWFTFLGSALVAVLSAGASIVTSQTGLSLLSKRYSLEITYPQSTAGTPVKFDGQDLRVEWRLIEKSITGEHSNLQSKASVFVLHNASTEPLAYPGSDGSAVVRLAPGSNYVKVVSEVDSSSSAAISVIVPDKPPNAATPPKADKRPGKAHP